MFNLKRAAVQRLTSLMPSKRFLPTNSTVIHDMQALSLRLPSTFSHVQCHWFCSSFVGHLNWLCVMMTMFIIIVIIEVNAIRSNLLWALLLSLLPLLLPFMPLYECLCAFACVCVYSVQSKDALLMDWTTNSPCRFRIRIPNILCIASM